MLVIILAREAGRSGGQGNNDGNQEQEQVHDSGRDQEGGDGARCRNFVLRKVLRKKAQKARRQCQNGRPSQR